MQRALAERLTHVSYSHVHWSGAVRVIAGQYPPMVGFEQVAAAVDFDALIALERETQPHVAPSPSSADVRRHGFPGRATGAGAGFVMAAFTRISPDGTRFAPPTSYGVYYAARTEATAIEETIYHTELIAAATAQPDQLFMRRVLVANVTATLADLRGQEATFPDVYDRLDYTAGQSVGRTCYQRADDGIVYDSVRDTGGECAAVFNPSCIASCRHSKFLAYHWNGERIVTVYDMKQRRTRRSER